MYMMRIAVIQQRFIPEITYYISSIRSRVLPVFANIEKEAEEVAERAFEALGRKYSNDDTDLGDSAEQANDEGIQFYSLMAGVRQGLINLTAAGLFHLIEQQLAFLFESERVPSNASPKLEESRDWILRHIGIDIAKLSSYHQLDALRLICNTVKHAEGPAARQLRERRSDLFLRHELRGNLHPGLQGSRIYGPMMGEDIFLNDDDLTHYGKAMTAFWEDLIGALQSQALAQDKANRSAGDRHLKR